MNSTWTKRLLIFAAVWNIIGGATSLADPANHFSQMYTRAPSTEDALFMYFYRCTWINVIAWGTAYGLAAHWHASRAAILLAGAAGKAVYFLACAALVGTGLGKPAVLFFGFGDLFMAALFMWAFSTLFARERLQFATA